MGGARCKWPHPSTGKPVKEKGKQPNQPEVCHERAREKNDLGRKKQLQGGKTRRHRQESPSPCPMFLREPSLILEGTCFMPVPST